MKQNNSIQNKFRKTLALALASLALLPAVHGKVFASESTAQVVTPAVDTSYTERYDWDGDWGRHGDWEMDMFPSIKEYINEITNLTEEEKKTLLAAEEELSPIYEKIKKLQQEIDSIGEKIYGEEGNIQENTDEDAWDKNSDLWHKFFESLSEKDSETEDISALIQASTSLTEDEKKLLLADEEAAKKERGAMEALETKVKEATQSQEAELTKLYAEVEAIFEKNKALYEKIFSSDAFNHGFGYEDDYEEDDDTTSDDSSSTENTNKKDN